MNVDNFAALVRPIVTLVAVGAWILYAHFDSNAALTIHDIVLVVVGFWFGSRTSPSSTVTTGDNTTVNTPVAVAPIVTTATPIVPVETSK